MRRRAGFALLAALLPAPALGQTRPAPRGRAGAARAGPRCLGPGALEPHRLWVTPHLGGFLYTLILRNSGAQPRRFAAALRLPGLVAPPGAGAPQSLAPRESRLLTLGWHERRVPDDAVFAALAIACQPR